MRVGKEVFYTKPQIMQNNTESGKAIEGSAALTCK